MSGKRRWGAAGSILIGAASGKSTSRVSTAALMYLSPWAVWPLIAVLAIVLRLFASRSTGLAVVIGAFIGIGGAALTLYTLLAFRDRGDRRIQIHAGATTGAGSLFVFTATVVGLFHRPPVDVWPDLWRLPEFVIKSFTIESWAIWFLGMVGCGISWNISRAARPVELDAKSEKEEEERSPLAAALDGARMQITKEADEKGMIEVELVGVPGKHTQASLSGLGPTIESAHQLRPGAALPIPNAEDQSKITMRIMPTDPHKEAASWPGIQHPGTSVADHPVYLGPYTDGVIAEDWLCGDEKTSRPLMHHRIGGVNGAGKSAGWRVPAAEALGRKDVALHGADLSGKVFQTFGPFLPYMKTVIGLHGTDDEGKAANALDALEFLREIKRDASERQRLYGQHGITQWSPECFARWGHTLDLIVIEEGQVFGEIKVGRGEEDAFDLLEGIAKVIRSSGKLLFFVTQRFASYDMPTGLRAQLPAAYCFGQDSTRDMAMMLPEDVMDLVTKSSDHPGSWSNRYPGKAVVVTANQPYERRGDRVRFFYATNERLIEELAKFAKRVRTDEEVRALMNMPAPVRTNANDGARTNMNEEDEQEEAYVDEDADVPNGDPNEPLTYTGPELSMNVPAYPDDPTTPLPTNAFREVIQFHLRAVLAEGRDEITAPEIVKLRPRTGHSAQNIRNELERLASRAEDWEVRVIPCTDPRASEGQIKRKTYRIIPALSVKVGAVRGAGE